MDWDDFKYFSAAANEGSVRGAAELLGVHPSTVTRRLDHFETRLGVCLFNRNRTGLTITPEGAEVIRSVERVADELGAVERLLMGRDQKMAGTIRITLPDVMAVTFLMEDFAAFSALYPDIELELIPSYQVLDLAKREADVAIRATDAPPEDLIGRPIATYSVAVYASADYLAYHDPVTNPEQCTWIEGAANNPVSLTREIRLQHFPHVPVRMRCENILLQFSAIKADVGLAVLPCGLADPDPKIVRIADIDPVPAQQIWLLTHPDLRGTSRIRALTEFLVEAFKRHQPMLSGELEPASLS
ncbi:MAG: LysR family transcriptional regulator [Proteobacteria bacterium]|nr:LysR family transcriptional regulator [Pseudomonadota bacterium]